MCQVMSDVHAAEAARLPRCFISRAAEMMRRARLRRRMPPLRVPLLMAVERDYASMRRRHL